MWVDQLLSAIHWEPLGLTVDWATAERDLGVNLPPDYKRMCEAFGPGEFSDYLDVLCVGQSRGPGLLRQWRACVDVAAEQESPDQPHPFFAPYQIFERGRSEGLIPWGVTQTESEFYWLANAGDPARWPIVARFPESDWDRFDKSTSEFIFQILADPGFGPYSVAGVFPQPYFDPLPPG
jgi:hypothetical protein